MERQPDKANAAVVIRKMKSGFIIVFLFQKSETHPDNTTVAARIHRPNESFDIMLTDLISEPYCTVYI
ncbi:hypothetical protein BG55_03090 [Erwinia mallotivora]|uniref:Uncharacterized protein n=1 Tax=Erwinia mallotivora TaxID=69222 RepID=A0A014MFK9_9GAMM|nr:hypothetical protein BG55_03090 [Erwinia mallotivora]